MVHPVLHVVGSPPPPSQQHHSPYVSSLVHSVLWQVPATCTRGASPKGCRADVPVTSDHCGWAWVNRLLQPLAGMSEVWSMLSHAVA